MGDKKNKPRHAKAFEVYYALGDRRSLVKLRDVLAGQGMSYSLKTYQNWSSENGWAEQVRRRDAAIFEKLQEKSIAKGTERMFNAVDSFKEVLELGLGQCIEFFRKQGIPQDHAAASKVLDTLDRISARVEALSGNADDRKAKEVAAAQVPDAKKPDIVANHDDRLSKLLKVVK